MHVHFLGEADDGRSISSHHARALASLGVKKSFAPAEDCTSQSDGPTCTLPREADLIHIVGRSMMSPRLLRDVLRLRSAGKPVVRVWTGEDLLWAKWHAPARAIAESLTLAGIRQFCRSQQELDQLAELGLQAALLPALSINASVRSQPQPLAKQLTLLACLPAAKRRFYGGELVDSLIRWLPNVRFLILTDQPPVIAAKNVEYLICVEDVNRSIQRATAILHPRLDRTISRLVIEALSHGRHVITGCDFPHVIQAQTVDDYLNAIRSLGRAASFNLSGREYVGKRHDWRIAAAVWLEALKRTLEEPDCGGGIRGGLGRAANIVREPLAGADSPPDVDSLPPEAGAFRALLQDSARTQNNSTHLFSQTSP